MAETPRNILDSLYGANDARQAELIERYLLEDDQRQFLADHDLTLDSLLAGRYQLALDRAVAGIFLSWNAKLGEIYFAQDSRLALKSDRERGVGTAPIDPDVDEYQRLIGTHASMNDVIDSLQRFRLDHIRVQASEAG